MNFDKIYNFFHYGYDKETYHKCVSQIKNDNYVNTRVVSIVSASILAILFLLSLFIKNFASFRFVYFIFFLACALIYAPYLGFRSVLKKHSLILSYLLMFILICYGFCIEACRSDVFTIYFIFIVCLVPSIFFDNFFRKALFLLVDIIFYCIIISNFKTAEVLKYDFENLFVLSVISFAFIYINQKNKMQHYISVNQNIEAQDVLVIKSTYDSLSKLFNRFSFFSAVEKNISKIKGYKAFCIFDIDDFKSVNDIYGHQTGDRVISTIAEISKKVFNIYDTNPRVLKNIENYTISYKNGNIGGRLGGDEFVFFLTDYNEEVEVIAVLQQLQKILAATEVDDVQSIKISVGLTSITSSDISIDTLYAQADKALYKAKKSGKNKICVFRNAD